MKQHAIDSALLGLSNWSLVPPNSKDFRVYGDTEANHRAQKWALENRYLLYRGPAAHCVHGLYRMGCCTTTTCNSIGMDHTQIWVSDNNDREIFLLSHPYIEDVTAPHRLYAEMHGLYVNSYPSDRWYNDSTLPVRLTIPSDSPVWPIERDIGTLLYISPIKWPEELLLP